MALKHRPTELKGSVRRVELSHDTCCDGDRALCGANVRGHHECPKNLSCGCEQCAVCADLVDEQCRLGCDR